MAFDIASIGSIVMQYAINPLLWLFLLLGVVGAILLILWIRKKRRFVYPVAEVVDLGTRTNINTDLKAGWLGKKLYLKGLWWSGEEVLRTSEGDVIEYFSTEDFQEVNGKRGVVCYRDPLRQNILIPVNKVKIEGKEFVASIAPANYTDVATQIVEDANSETNDWKDKLLQFVGWAIVVIASLIAIIVIVQYVKTAQDKAQDLLIQAGSKGAEACKDICKQAIALARSG